MSKLDSFKALQDVCFKIYKAKNADYGDAFASSISRHGLIAAVVRMEDKFERFNNLLKSPTQEVKDESIQRTLIDLSNYALMTVIEISDYSGESTFASLVRSLLKDLRNSAEVENVRVCNCGTCNEVKGTT